jgi:hypothetical protein
LKKKKLRKKKNWKRKKKTKMPKTAILKLKKSNRFRQKITGFEFSEFGNANRSDEKREK